MRVLASLTLLTNTSLEVGAKSCLVIDLASIGGHDLSDLLEKRLQEIGLVLLFVLGFLIETRLFLNCASTTLHVGEHDFVGDFLHVVFDDLGFVFIFQAES